MAHRESFTAQHADHPLPRPCRHDYSKANFQQSESNDGNGVVQGSYSVNLPDGRIQTVTYHANDYDGNIAEVTYSGEAQYPPAPAGGYVAAAPVHAVHAVHAPVSTLPLFTLSTPLSMLST